VSLTRKGEGTGLSAHEAGIGAVSFIQHFGSALNLTLYFYLLAFYSKISREG
jgi:hypothetical protein